MELLLPIFREHFPYSDDLHVLWISEIINDHPAIGGDQDGVNSVERAFLSLLLAALPAQLNRTEIVPGLH